LDTHQETVIYSGASKSILSSAIWKVHREINIVELPKHLISEDFDRVAVAGETDFQTSREEQPKCIIQIWMEPVFACSQVDRSQARKSLKQPHHFLDRQEAAYPAGPSAVTVRAR